MTRTKAQLKHECSKRRILLDLDANYSNMELYKILGNYEKTLLPTITWGLERRLELDSLMLSFRYDKLKHIQQHECLISADWIAEEKFNGCRLLIAYHPEEGFTFYSRNESDVDFLPIDYTEKCLLIHDNKVQRPGEFKNTLKYSFILDCEVIAQANIDTTEFRKVGNVTASEQNATSAILSIDTEDSHKLQMTQAPLVFHIFDILYYKDWITAKPLRVRKQVQEKLVNHLRDKFNLPFINSVVYEDKTDLFDRIVSEGGEGIVLKHLEKPYITTSSRKRDVQVKYKRSMVQAKDDEIPDIDAFITGFSQSTKGKANEDYIGGLKVSVYLDSYEEGNMHHVATISGIPLDLRKRLTILDSEGEPTLNPKYMYKVITIDGMSASSKSLRFTHASVPDWTFRDDKSPKDCVMPKSFLTDNQI